MRLLSLTQFIWRPSVPSSPALALTESIHVGMSLSWCECIPSQGVNCVEIGCLDYVSMRLLSPTQFIWRPSVPQFSSSGTHRINTRSNVTVPDVSVFHHKESIVLRLGAWLCKHETALPHYNSFGDHPSPSSPALALTESIHSSNVTVPDVSVSIARSQLCFIGCLIM